MLRILAGFLWFIVIWIGGLFVLGAVIGGTADCDYPTAQEVMACARAAGERFGARYGGMLLLASLVLAIAGTWLQILPGTKKRGE